MSMFKSLVTQENTKCDAFYEKCIWTNYDVFFSGCQTLCHCHRCELQTELHRCRQVPLQTNKHYKHHHQHNRECRNTIMFTCFSCGFMGQTDPNTHRIDLAEDKGTGTCLFEKRTVYTIVQHLIWVIIIIIISLKEINTFILASLNWSKLV